MVGASYPAIVRYDSTTQRLYYYDEWLDDLKQYFTYEENAIFRKSTVVGKHIYAPCCRGNAVLVFDMETYEYKIHEVGDKGSRFSSICYDGEDFWLAPRSGDNIVRWNEESGKYKMIPAHLGEQGSGMYTYSDIWYEDSRVFLVPSNTKQPFSIDTKMETIKLEDESCLNSVLIRKTSNGHDMHFLSCIADKLVYINDNEEKEIYPLYFPKEIAEKHLKQNAYAHKVFVGEIKKDENVALYESYDDALNEYLDYCCKESASNALERDKVTIGKDIFQGCI